MEWIAAASARRPKTMVVTSSATEKPSRPSQSGWPIANPSASIAPKTPTMIARRIQPIFGSLRRVTTYASRIWRVRAKRCFFGLGAASGMGAGYGGAGRRPSRAVRYAWSGGGPSAARLAARLAARSARTRSSMTAASSGVGAEPPRRAGSHQASSGEEGRSG